MSNQLISIIVPVYNVASYLDCCINSLVQQTYSNIEIILVDDGSTDGSDSKCDSWQIMDERIKVIHTENFGVSHARNIGLRYASGDFIGFVDADDWLEYDAYECLLKQITDNDADLSGGGYVRESMNESKIDLYRECSRVLSREEVLKKIFNINKKNILRWELWDKLFKRSLVTGISFNESISTAEDALFFWQIMKRARNFAYAPLFKYHYRMRDGSAVHSGISPRTISSVKAMRLIWQSAQQENKELRENVWAQYICTIIGCTREMIVYDVKGYKKEIIENQRIIRSDIISVLSIRGISYKLILGAIFLCLPFEMICYLTWVVKKRTD